MSTRRPSGTPVNRTDALVAAAEADRDAAENAALTADALIREAEKITSPPEAKTIADQAKAKAKDVRPLFQTADTAWKAALAATDEGTAKTEAAKAKTSRKDADRALAEARTLLADANTEASKGGDEKTEIAKFVDEARAARSAVKGYHRQARQAAREARRVAEDTPSDDTRRLAQRAASSESTVKAALDDAEQALREAEGASRSGNKADAEEAARDAKKAQKAAEDALETASDAAEDIKVVAEDAERARKAAEEAKAKTFRYKVQQWARRNIGKLVVLVIVPFLLMCILVTLVTRGGGLPGNEPTATAAATATAPTRGDGVFEEFATLPPDWEEPTPAATSTP